LHQLGPLRDDRERLPVLQFLDARIEVLQLAFEPRGQGWRRRKRFLDCIAESRGARRAAMLERRLCLPQQPDEASNLLVLRFVPGPLGLAFGLLLPGPLGGGRRIGLLLKFPLAACFLGGDGGRALPFSLRLDCPAVQLDHLVSPRNVPCDNLLEFGARVRREGLPLRFEPGKRGRVLRVARPFAVPGECGGGCIDLGLSLLRAAFLREHGVALGGEYPVDVLVLAARGPDQVAQLVRIRHRLGGELAGAG